MWELLGQQSENLQPTSWANVGLLVLYAVLRDGLPWAYKFMRQKTEDEKVQAEIRTKGYDQMIVELKAENKEQGEELRKHREQAEAETAELRQELKAVRQAEHNCQIKQAQQEAKIEYLQAELALLKQAKTR